MASKLENTLGKIGDVIETIVGTKQNTSLAGYVGNGGNQSNLERIGIESRMNHLRQNEWGREMPYSKLLVESEYEIQKEFIV